MALCRGLRRLAAAELTEKNLVFTLVAQTCEAEAACRSGMLDLLGKQHSSKGC